MHTCSCRARVGACKRSGRSKGPCTLGPSVRSRFPSPRERFASLSGSTQRQSGAERQPSMSPVHKYCHEANSRRHLSGAGDRGHLTSLATRRFQHTSTANMVHVPTPNPPDIPDVAAVRCGVQRNSMRTNVLIHRPGLSEVSKATFTNPPPDKTFGVPKMADPEGARDVTMMWKEHVANPDSVPGACALSWCAPCERR
jgi:Domain of unknown function (DUF4483)